MENTKRVIIDRMVANGYALMGHDEKWFEEQFSVETLLRFEKKFMEYKRGE